MLQYHVLERERRPLPCACEDGAAHCLCTAPEVLEPVKVVRKSRTTADPTQPAVTPRFRQVPCLCQQAPNCPCKTTVECRVQSPPNTLPAS